jgi:hypothetical protein
MEAMSALPLKGDTCSALAHVRFVPIAGMAPALSHHFKINPGVIALWQRRAYFRLQLF